MRRSRSGLAAADSGQDDDRHDEQHRDHSRCYSADPVEARVGEEPSRDLDLQALAGQDFLGELALQSDVGGAWPGAGQGIGYGDGGEGDGGDGGCAHDDPGGEDAVGSIQGRGACRGRVILWQVREQRGQFVPGAGVQGLPGSLVELGGGDPAGLEGLAQLAECPLAVGVGYPEVAGRVVGSGCVHDSCSFETEFGG